jgi:hypothetical protein
MSRSGGTYVFKIADMGSILTASTAAFGANFGTFTEGAGRWVAYQHISRAFFVGGANGNVRMISSVCGTPVVSLTYKPTQFPSNQVTEYILQTTLDQFRYNFAGWGTKLFRGFMDSPVISGSGDSATITNAVGTPISMSGNKTNFASAIQFYSGDGTQDIAIEENGGQINYFNVSTPKVNRFVYTLQNPVDWAFVDYLYFVYWGNQALHSASYTSAGPSTSGEVEFKFQDSTGGTWYSATTRSAVENIPGIGNSKCHVWVDLTSIPLAVRKDLKKIMLPMLEASGHSLNGTLRSMAIYPYRGGKAYKLQTQATDTLSANPPQEDLVYYVRYVSADGLYVSKPVVRTIPPSVHEGLRPIAGIPKIGQSVAILIKKAESPWASDSTIQVYRKVIVRASNETRYYLVDTLANPSGAFTTVAYQDDYSDIELIEGAFTYLSEPPESDGISPSGTTAIANMVCGCSWKGSNVLFDNAGLAYFSKVGTYGEFMFPNDGYQVDPEDLTRPRFEQVTPDALPIIAAIGKDALYMFSENRVYAMSGDYIATCPPARPLPNASGILGARAYCGYGGGVIYAARDGLWFIQVPFGFSGSAEQVESKEITISNRACWEWLYNGGGSNITISTDKSEKDIWVFNGDRALHFTKESGWVRVLWGGSSDAKIFSAYHQTYGLVIGMSSHKFGLIGEFLTDGGTDLPGATGSTFIADFESRKFTDYRKVLRALVNVENPASGRTVTLNATSDRGTSENLTFNGANPVYNQSWNMSGAPSGGRWVKFKLSISPGTIIESATIQMTRHDTRRGK